MKKDKMEKVKTTCEKCNTEENCIHKEHKIKPIVLTKTLSEKRKELLKHTEEAFDDITAEDIFEQIREQDKEAVDDLKRMSKGLSHNYYEGIEMVSVKELFKVIKKIFGEFK